MSEDKDMAESGGKATLPILAARPVRCGRGSPADRGDPNTQTTVDAGLFVIDVPLTLLLINPDFSPHAIAEEFATFSPVPPDAQALIDSDERMVRLAAELWSDTDADTDTDTGDTP